MTFTTTKTWEEKRDELAEKEASLMDKTLSPIEQANMPYSICTDSFKSGADWARAETLKELEEVLSIHAAENLGTVERYEKLDEALAKFTQLNSEPSGKVGNESLKV